MEPREHNIISREPLNQVNGTIASFNCTPLKRATDTMVVTTLSYLFWLDEAFSSAAWCSADGVKASPVVRTHCLFRASSYCVSERTAVVYNMHFNVIHVRYRENALDR